MEKDYEQHETISYIGQGNKLQEIVSIPFDVFSVKCHQRTGRTRHSHTCIEMFYIVSGSTEHIMEWEDGTSATQTLIAGNYLILDRTVSHAFRQTSKDFLLLNLLFLPRLIDANFDNSVHLHTLLEHPTLGIGQQSPTFTLANQVLTDPDGRILHLFERAWKAYKAMELGYLALLRCYIIEILILSCKKILPGVSPGQKNRTISFICDYINTHFPENITLSAICKDQYLNASFISRKFKESTGMTFEGYLQQVRIQSACTRLIETDLSVEEIGDKVGYSDPGSFRKIFKRILGCSPSEFRKHNQ